jgi:H+-translocating NAD(P) transhydrogenase subunit alpha
MTGVLIVSLYFIALTAFLGLDIISKVPATMYALVLATLGTLAAVIIVGAVSVTAQSRSPLGTGLGLVATGVAAVAAGAGLGAMGRLLQPFLKKGRGT